MQQLTRTWACVNCGATATHGRTRSGRRLVVIWREQDAMDIFVDLQSEIFVITAYEV